MSAPANTRTPVNLNPASKLPAWVPAGARLYLSHVTQGQSLRALGRVHGCHASTVLRQIRQVETRRDDPLVDEALRRLDLSLRNRPSPPPAKDPRMMMTRPAIAPPQSDSDDLTQEAMQALRHLVRPKALLIVAADMPKSVVTCETAEGTSERLAVLAREVAEAMALNGWIRLCKQGRVSSYVISATGRMALRRHCVSLGLDYEPFGTPPETPPSKRTRYGQMESPVTVLARRQDARGAPFLDAAQVQAAARLREDFVMAQLEEEPVDCAAEMVLALEKTLVAKSDCRATMAARQRLGDMLRDLGPGLGDMVLRCCCRLEGVEAAEQALGWSARSGKIVLRIALQHAVRHYTQLASEDTLIG